MQRRPEKVEVGLIGRRGYNVTISFVELIWLIGFIRAIGFMVYRVLVTCARRSFRSMQKLSQGDATSVYHWLYLLLSFFLSPSGSREQGAAQRYTACCPTPTRVNNNLMRSLRDLRPDFVARSAIAGDPVRFQTTSLLR